MNKLKLVYYTDALCGWCYGFSPILKKIQAEFKDHLEFEVVSGGLFLGNRAGLVNDVAPHIKAGAYKRVEEATGVKFGIDFLDRVFGDGNLVLNSFYPAVALCVVKEEMPEKAFEFTELLLEAYYFDGLDSQNIEGHKPYFSKLGLEGDKAIQLSKETRFQELALADFERFRQAEVNVFPSLMIKINNEEQSLSNGSISYEVLQNKLSSLLEENS